MDGANTKGGKQTKTGNEFIQEIHQVSETNLTP